MAEQQLTLTDEERKYLAGLLDEVLRDKLVEEHRTRKPSFRTMVEQEENVLQSIRAKLGTAR